MRIVLSILTVAILSFFAIVGHRSWRRHHPRAEVHPPPAAQASDNGFQELAPYNNAPLGLVLIVTAPGCPAEDVRRADEMQELLAQQGVPSRRAEIPGFSYEGETDADQLDLIMRGRMPVVFVNGLAKNDPSVAEVAAEYYSRGRAPIVDY